ncbi:MAG: hypothetical protein ACI9VT_001354 [Psychroserpens sp.]
MNKLFILGFTKCATTSLYDSLVLHPKIHNSGLKEPHYHFSKILGASFNGVADKDTVKQMFVTEREAYLNLYDNSKINIDASAMSVTDVKILELIKQENPSSKAIIVLRCPIERAFSAYSHMVRDVRENLTFTEAIEEELNAKRVNHLPIWQYIDSSRYVDRITAARKLFGNKLLILDYERLTANFDDVLNQVSDFLEIENISWKNSSSNKSGNPKSKLLQKMLMRDSAAKRLFVRINPRKLTSLIKSNLLKYNTDKKPYFSFEERTLIAFNLKDELGKIEAASHDYQILNKVYKNVRALNED